MAHSVVLPGLAAVTAEVLARGSLKRATRNAW